MNNAAAIRGLSEAVLTGGLNDYFVPSETVPERPFGDQTRPSDTPAVSWPYYSFDPEHLFTLNDGRVGGVWIRQLAPSWRVVMPDRGFVLINVSIFTTEPDRPTSWWWTR